MKAGAGPIPGVTWTIWYVHILAGRSGWKLFLVVFPVIDFDALCAGLEFLFCAFMFLYLAASALTFGECMARDFYMALKIVLRSFCSLFQRKKKES